MALLTQTDKTRIRQMREDGTPVSYIAAAMELTVEEVEAVLARKEPPEQPKTRTEKKYRTEPISDEVKAEVISLIKDGATIASIKERTGVSQASISRIKAAMKEKEPTTAATAADSREITVQVKDSTKTAESQALKAAKAKLLAIYETLSPEECRAWEMGEVYAEVVRGCGE